MFIHGGTGLYGKVDQVPGLFYVATRFFHLYYIPLIPLKSFVVRVGSEKEDDFDGSSLGLNFKSIAFAWLRLGLLLASGFACFGIVRFAVLRLEGGAPPWSRLGVVVSAAAVLFYLLYASYGFTRARPLRALELARHVGIAPEELAEYFVDSDTLPGLEDGTDNWSPEHATDDTMRMTNDP